MNLNHIRALTVERGLTGRELAKIIGLSETSIYQKLNGKRQFKAKEIAKLAEYFKVPISELFDKNI